MANLVTKFRYYKPSKVSERGRYARYIATRDGVEFLQSETDNHFVTESQKSLIDKLLRDYPDSTEMLEYEDYIRNPTVRNASEFITRAIEDNVKISKYNTYADYIATRPRVEKTGSHGLFAMSGDADLEKVSKEISEHSGNLWTMIISLRREDAERLSYDTASRWRELLRSKTEEIAEAFKIPMTALKWYGAFHNESHHPHIHVMIYTDRDDCGFLTRQGVEKLRSTFAKDIFRDEMYHSAEEQTKKRNELKAEWKTMLDEIFSQINLGVYENEEIQNKLIELSIRLNNTKAKKRYGYLKKDVKELIDSIVDLLSEDENIAKLYDMWYEEKYKILRMYSKNVPPKIRLSENDEFKSLKNDIIREALRILENGNEKIKTVPPPQKRSNTAQSEDEKDNKKGKDNSNSQRNYQQQKKAYYQSRKRVYATSVTRLFKGLANTFSDKLGYDSSKNLPEIDKRLRKEIEDKKNAELTMT